MKETTIDLKQLIEAACFDWENISIDPDGGPLNYECPFDLTPQDFITFAKADLFSKDVRGLINGLSNAKRAVDCQTDSFITCLGFSPEKLKEQLGDEGCKELDGGIHTKSDWPLKFRFLAALGVATPAIISRMRKLRNVLEHEYRRPRHKDVCDAIDVAELFTQACYGRLRSSWGGIEITSGNFLKKEHRSEISLSFTYNVEHSAHFSLLMVDCRKFSEANKMETKTGLLKPKDRGFISVLKLLLKSDVNNNSRSDLANLLTQINVPFSKKYLGRKIY